MTNDLGLGAGLDIKIIYLELWGGGGTMILDLEL